MCASLGLGISAFCHLVVTSLILWGDGHRSHYIVFADLEPLLLPPGVWATIQGPKTFGRFLFCFRFSFVPGGGGSCL